MFKVLRRTKSRRDRIPDCWSCNMKRARTEIEVSARDVQVSGGARRNVGIEAFRQISQVPRCVRLCR